MTTDATDFLPNLLDLEVTLRRQSPDGYRVQFTLDDDQTFPAAPLSSAVLPWLGAAVARDEAERLRAWFYADPRVREAWTAIRERSPQLRVRLHLNTDAPELHTLPWELLCTPEVGAAENFLAAAGDTPFSRYLATGGPITGPVEQMPLKLLVAIAAPADLTTHGLSVIDADLERRTLAEALAFIPPERLALSFVDGPVTLAALQDALQQDVHILHIVAHGAFDHTSQTALLYLADAQNRTQALREDELRAVVASSGASLRLVYLSSCETAARSAGDAWRGLAPQLLAAGVPAVLAMQEKVGMQSARAFAATFYQALLATGYVDWASNHARAALLAANLPGASIPVLLSRLADNHLFLVPSPAALLPQLRTDLIQRVQQRWVAGMLHLSPRAGATADRVLHEAHDAVEPLPGVGVPQQDNRIFPAEVPILPIFSDESDRALLILGEAGAGKTMLLLELAEAGLKQAQQKSAEPIPVVFELSHWTPAHPTLDAWLIAELDKRYQVPPTLGNDLLARQDIALLLDGLDELRVEWQILCVDQINRYRASHGGLTAIAVTCERSAYYALPNRLQLQNAVYVQLPPTVQSGAGTSDLEIQIEATADDGVAVTLLIDRHRHFAGGQRDLAALPSFGDAPDPRVGEQLFDWLFGTTSMRTEWLRVYRQSRQRTVRLRIAAEQAALMAVPWEMMRNPIHDPPYAALLADANTSFYRFLPNQQPRPDPSYKHPLKLLVAIVAPPGLPQFGRSVIDPLVEKAFLESVFFGLEDAIAVEFVGDQQPLSLALLNASLGRKSYDLLHIISHGAYDAQRGVAALLMARSAGDRVEPVTVAALADLLARFSSDMPRWVILSHAQGARQSSAPAWRLLAQTLLQVGVYAVGLEQSTLSVANDGAHPEVGDDTVAYHFYRTFYQAVIDTGRLDRAYSVANAALLAEHDSGATLPVALLSRTTDLRVTLTERAPLPMQDPDRGRKLTLLRRVRSNWVDSILKPSLNGRALIEIPKASAPELVADATARDIDVRQQRIYDIFRQADGALLILGAPGSGKTFILLELARDLIVAARENPDQPIPVVFNLASWRDTEANLTAWMVRELSTMYYIPERFSQGWIEDDQILPLLDGFDEVRPTSRLGCIQAINAYRTQHPQGQIVVCSRAAEYETLLAEAGTEHCLLLNAGVRLLGLTRPQIDDYLRVAGPALSALRAVMNEDQTLFELAQSPLMLNVMVVAYADVAEDELRGIDTVEERRRHLFAHYVARAFKPIGTRQRNLFPVLQTKHWLSWLAQHLNWHSQSIFLLENLQPSWLAQTRSLWIYVLGSRLTVGLLGGLIGGLIISLALVVIDIQWITLHPDTSFSLADVIQTNLLRGVLEGGFGGVMGGLIIGVIDGVGFMPHRKERTYLPVPTTRESVTRAVWVGLTIWVLVTLAFGAFFGALDWLHWIDWFWCYGESDDPSARTYWWRCAVGYLGEGVQVSLIVALCFITIFRTVDNRQDPKDDIRTTEYLHWSGEEAWRGGVYGLVRGLLVGVLVAILGLLGVIEGSPFKAVIPDDLFAPLVIFIITLVSVVFDVVRRGLRGTLLETETSRPNQGIQLSLRNAITIGLSYGGSFGLLGAAIGVMLGTFVDQILISSLIYSAYGIFFGVLASIWYGGLDILKHYWLRATLSQVEGAPPLHRTIAFFDNAAELVLLRKAGGSYLFLHRLLQDYFAELDSNDAPVAPLAAHTNNGAVT